MKNLSSRPIPYRFLAWLALVLLLLPACNFIQGAPVALSSPTLALSLPSPTLPPLLTGLPATQPPLPTSLPATQPPLPTSPPATQPPQPTSPPATLAAAQLPAPGSSGFAVAGVAPEDVLNVRSAPGVDNPVIGTLLPAAQGIQLAGEGRLTPDGAVWGSLQWGGQQGWVNTSYLAAQYGTAEAALAERANQAVYALQSRDLAALAALVHPQQGLRFSPYGYVQAQDQLFSAAQVAGLGSDPTVYTWGAFDGSGAPIQMAFEQYFMQFVYDQDFARPQQLGFNKFLGQGNTLNNLVEFYPQAQFVEYYFSGFDPQYSGMDWRSLRLVFVQEGGVWYLAGIVHDEWTT